MPYYGPRVLPQPFKLGDIIDRVAQGYVLGRQMRRDRRAEREHDEDRQREAQGRRVAALAQPGASTLGDFLDEQLKAGRQPITDQSLRQIGRADSEPAPIEFRRPGPTNVTLRSGKEIPFQDRAPFMAEDDVVIDPAAARQERTLARYLDADAARMAPWERAGFSTKQDYIDYLRDEAKAKGAGRPRTSAEMRPPITLNQALDAVDRLYGTWNPATGSYDYPFPPEERYERARAMVRGEHMQPVPEKPMVAPPIRATTPATGEERESGIDRFIRGIADLFRGRGAESADQSAAPAGQPRPETEPDMDEEQGDSFGLPAARSLGELDLSPQEQEKYLGLIDQGWSHDDAVYEIAADAWDALVQAGTPPAEATRVVSQKYGRSGAR